MTSGELIESMVTRAEMDSMNQLKRLAEIFTGSPCIFSYYDYTSNCSATYHVSEEEIES